MMELGAVDIAGGMFGGLTAFAFMRWAVNLFFVRIDKREDRVDAGMAELLTRLTEQVKALTASEEVLRKRITAAEDALHDCKVRDAEREATIHELQARVEQLSALPTNERELP